jgi:decaprenyl-phosphate phosphoribosyltransferase
MLTSLRAARSRSPLLQLLRPQQWVKNGFVAAPLFFTPSAVSLGSVGTVTLGIVSFCSLSSAVYILNDLIDRDRDLVHPTKQERPLAARTVSTATALTLMGALATVALVLALSLSPRFAAIASIYLLNNAAYSFWLKHVAIVDVFMIAFGFLLRMRGGAELVHVEPSVWLEIMTGLLALFLALAKRRDDLVLSVGRDQRGSLEGYNKPFLDAALIMLLASLMVAYLIYTTDREVMVRLGTPDLVLTTPFVMAGLLRYLQITLVEERSGSPTTMVLSDRFLIGCVLGWIATFGFMLYA